MAGAIISQVIKGMPPAACRHLLLPLLPLLLPPPKCLIAITITILLFLLLRAVWGGWGGGVLGTRKGNERCSRH